MSSLIDLVDRYVATWNERDARRRRELIARTWSEGGNYLDPLMQGDGHAGIDAMLHGVQEKFPGHQLRRTSEVDAHHDRVRFCWELASDAGAVLVKGVDFGTVAGDRLQTITGFLDQAPAAAQQ
jgi:hypothetical protein